MISATGEQLGVIATKDALSQAKDEGLDLVEVAPNERPPVCRIMDFGKYKYEKGKIRIENKYSKKGTRQLMSANIPPRVIKRMPPKDITAICKPANFCRAFPW